MPPFKSTNKKSAVVAVTRTRKPPVPEVKTPMVETELQTIPQPQAEPKELRRATFTHIAKELNEEKREPQRQIKRILRILGIDAALALLAEALDIEATGGMMCLDGSRRRTRGGVFFFLVKQKHPDLFPKRSWKETRTRRKQKKATKNPAQVQPKPNLAR